MMKLITSLTLIGSAAAFAPALTGKATTALNLHHLNENDKNGHDEKMNGKKIEDPSVMLGAQAPLGFFDPLGMLENADQARFDRLRYVEIKHGRICQLAFLGQIVTRAGIHLPGTIDYAGDTFASYPNGLAALVGPDSIPAAGALQIFAFIGALELFVMKDIEGTGNEHVGDFRNGFIDFGWKNFDEETKLSKRAIELNNGRAAMMGILGLMVHEQLGGSLPLVGEMGTFPIIPLGYDADLPIIGHLQ